MDVRKYSNINIINCKIIYFKPVDIFLIQFLHVVFITYLLTTNDLRSMAKYFSC